VYPVIVGGAAIVGAALVAGGWRFSLPLLGLLLAAMLAEMFPVKIESVAAGTTSFATVFIATAATVYDWRYGALVGAGGMLLSHVEPERWIAPIKIAYNMALYGVAGAAAGAFAAIVPLGLRLGFGGSAVFYVVDVGLLSWVVAATRRQRITTVARSFYASTAWPFFVMAFLTAIVVHLWRSDPASSLLVRVSYDGQEAGLAMSKAVVLSEHAEKGGLMVPGKWEVVHSGNLVEISRLAEITFLEKVESKEFQEP